MGAQNQAVSRALRLKARPLLQSVGFEDFTERKAWRRSGDLVEVVNFRGVGGYLAAGVGCTPYSFAVSAGVRYGDCEAGDSKPAEFMARPDYYQCTFEVQLGKRLRQPHEIRPWGEGPGRDRADVWAVREDVGNLDEVVEDAVATLVDTGLPLLAEFSTPELAYEALLTRDSIEPDFGVPGIGMPGAPGSPRWTGVVRCLAVRLGRESERDIAGAPVLTSQRS